MVMVYQFASFVSTAQTKIHRTAPAGAVPMHGLIVLATVHFPQQGGHALRRGSIPCGSLF
jgi:hypothetical protein